MAKQTYEIKDFSGGLNCYSDARDIQDTEFSQFWNVTSSQAGILKVGGSLVEHLYGLPHTNANFQVGYGLFATSVDFSTSIIDGEFENGYEQGTVQSYADSHSGSPFDTNPVIQLQDLSPYHVNTTDLGHSKDDYYNNYSILISSGDGAGQVRRIVDYDGATNKARLDSALGTDATNSSTYKIFRWVGDGSVFGNEGSTDYIDKAGESWHDNINSYNEYSEYFLRTEVSSITTNQTKPLGFVTYNPKTDETFSANDTDSTTIGATTLKAGVEYLLCFYCKAEARYYGYGAQGTSHGERVPFVQLYSDSVTDGTNTGLYLFESNAGPTFLSGAESTYDYADSITTNYVANGGFGTGDASNWTKVDSGSHLTFSAESSSNQYGGNGTSGKLESAGTYALADSNDAAFVPNAYVKSDVISVNDNQWYELFFAYSSSAGGIYYSVVDTTSADDLATPLVTWTPLEDTGSLSTYKFIGENSNNGIPKPCKFFVPNNSGSNRNLRILFANKAASQTAQFDAVTLKKSFPDLLSMANNTRIGNPYSSEATQWNKYQFKFKIPSEYNDATDWVLNLNAGTYGNQTFATGTSASQTIYFDSIRLETNETDNLIFLNDNTSTRSKVNIYSSSRDNWIENDLIWAGKNMKPVYNYINGFLKISDANFNSGNRGKIFYYLNKNQLGSDKIINGWRTRDSVLSKAPSLIVSSGGDNALNAEPFNALAYMNSYTFSGGVQKYGATPTATNWECDKLDTTGRILSYWYYSNNYSDEELFLSDGTTELTKVEPQTSLQDNEGFLSETSPFYLAFAGNDGTSNDAASKISSFTTGKLGRIEIEFDYEFSSSYRNGQNDYLSETYHPYFEITAGKDGNSLFSGSTISSPNRDALIVGQKTIMDTEAIAVFEDTNGNPVDLQEEAGQTPWLYSDTWPWDETQSGVSSGRQRKGSKKFKAVINFTENNNIACTDDVLIKFQVFYPSRNGIGGLNDCMFGSSSSTGQTDGDFRFPRYDRIRFSNISSYYYNTNWTPEVDGMSASQSTLTKVNFTFGTPNGSTAFGWEERIYKVGVSSVNIFDEESSIKVNTDNIGVTPVAETSAITAGQCPDITVYVGYDVAKDEYRKKLKYYMKDNNSDIWYLQFVVDLEKNKISSTTSNYSATGVNDKGNQCYIYDIPREKILNYNEVDSYESQTLVSQDLSDNELVCDYKASVVANSRLYVGNIRQNGEHLPDRMLKSPIGKYNILPKSNFIDVAINDGDEITALEYYKDKLLQYKKRKVFVINTSGDFEFLEDTFDNVGVEAPYQVCKTPFGIAWANQSGLYLYNGESLVNLIKNKIPNNENDAVIAKNYWIFSDDPNDNNKPLVGYDNITKDIVIKRGLTTNTSTTTSIPDGYVYNLESGTWYFTSKSMNAIAKHGDSPNCSNFTTDSKGNLMLYTTADSSLSGIDVNLNDVLKWQHAKATDDSLSERLGVTGTNVNAKPLYFTTKDYTFGAINSRDKIYKVYVTYKSTDKDGASVNSKIEVKYATNGSGSFDGNTFSDDSENYSTSTGLIGSTTWTTAVLKPTTPINNVFSIALQFQYTGAQTLPAPGFEINDISIIYRPKRIK